MWYDGEWMHVWDCWPVSAVVQCPLQPLHRGRLQRVGHQRHQVSGQAAATFRTHGVPLIGHSTRTWRWHENVTLTLFLMSFTSANICKQQLSDIFSMDNNTVVCVLLVTTDCIFFYYCKRNIWPYSKTNAYINAGKHLWTYQSALSQKVLQSPSGSQAGGCLYRSTAGRCIKLVH